MDSFLTLRLRHFLVVINKLTGKVLIDEADRDRGNHFLEVSRVLSQPFTNLNNLFLRMPSEANQQLVIGVKFLGPEDQPSWQHLWDDLGYRIVFHRREAVLIRSEQDSVVIPVQDSHDSEVDLRPYLKRRIIIGLTKPLGMTKIDSKRQISFRLLQGDTDTPSLREGQHEGLVSEVPEWVKLQADSIVAVECSYNNLMHLEYRYLATK